MNTERPILFSAPMVRAILEGRKTQTRRVVKLPHNNPLGQWEPTTFSGIDARGVEHPERAAVWHTRTGDALACPYGQPGDRLWVRETWSPAPPHRPGMPAIYMADFADDVTRGIWKPSIHMPRWASRITLEVTGVRVERLQAISYEDAIAEGVIDPATIPPFPHTDKETPEQFARRTGYPQRAYAQLWDEINGEGAWAANPWVWAITFKLVQP